MITLSLIALVSSFVILFMYLIHKRKIVIYFLGWVEIIFCLTFFSGIGLKAYYTHFYLGGSESPQKMYVALSYSSVILLILIIGLRIVKYYNGR